MSRWLSFLVPALLAGCGAVNDKNAADVTDDYTYLSLVSDIEAYAIGTKDYVKLMEFKFTIKDRDGNVVPERSRPATVKVDSGSPAQPGQGSYYFTYAQTWGPSAKASIGTRVDAVEIIGEPGVDSFELEPTTEIEGHVCEIKPSSGKLSDVNTSSKSTFNCGIAIGEVKGLKGTLKVNAYGKEKEITSDGSDMTYVHRFADTEFVDIDESEKADNTLPFSNDMILNNTQSRRTRESLLSSFSTLGDSYVLTKKRDLSLSIVQQPTDQTCILTLPESATFTVRTSPLNETSVAADLAGLSINTIYSFDPFSEKFTIDCSGGDAAETIVNYDNGEFNETNALDGSVEGSIAVTLEKGKFALTGAFTEGTHYNVTGVPDGLTVAISATDETTASITLTGQATAHAGSDSVTDAKISFLKEAFADEVLPDDGSDEHTFKVNFADPEYTLSVTVTGMTGGTLSLRNNINLDPLAVTSNGTHLFSNKVTANDGYSYDVRILADPAGQTCTFTGSGAGTASGAVTVTINCSATPPTYTVGGDAIDVPFGETLTLTLTYGAMNTTEDINIMGLDPMGMGATPYEFTADLNDGDAYSVTIKTNVMTGSCATSDTTSGTISSANVTIDYTCM